MGFSETEITETATGEVRAVHASRRTILMSAGAVSLAGALAACGSNPSMPGTGATTSGRGVTAKTSDIPVGGGTIFSDQKIVVTRPTSNDFKAFTAICTHLGCTVGTVANGLIMCPCHGSEYSITDGSVKRGPALSPLAAKQLTVSGSEITVAA